MNAEDPRDAGLAAYAAFFERITRDSVPELRRLGTATMHFRDPFNDARGIEHVIRVFDKMFEDASEIRFKIRQTMRRGECGMLLWDFSCRPRSRLIGGVWRIEGASEIHLAPDGRIAAHLDHWDAGGQFYERLPGLGSLIRLVKRRLQVN